LPPKQQDSSSHELLGFFLFLAWVFASIEIWVSAPADWQWYGKGLLIAIVGALLTVFYYVFESVMRRK
jgi:uncharacterized membrane protein